MFYPKPLTTASKNKYKVNICQVQLCKKNSEEIEVFTFYFSAHQALKDVAHLHFLEYRE